VPAYVIAFRMTDAGGIEQVCNTAKSGRGTHIVQARNRHDGRPGPSLNDDGYWLVYRLRRPDTVEACSTTRLESIMLSDPPLKRHSTVFRSCSSRRAPGIGRPYYTTFRDADRSLKEHSLTRDDHDRTISPLRVVRVGCTGHRGCAGRTERARRCRAFRRGFTPSANAKWTFRLLRPANVVLFWVTPDGGIELFYPVRSRDKTLRRAGGNAISVSEIPSPIQAPVINGAPVSGRAGQFAPAGSLLTGAPARDESSAVSGYWVLLTSDAPITALDVQTGSRSCLAREAGSPSSTGWRRCSCRRHAVGAVCGGRGVALN